MIELIQAHDAGKKIQFWSVDECWKNCANNKPCWAFNNTTYRVEPEEEWEDASKTLLNAMVRWANVNMNPSELKALRSTSTHATSTNTPWPIFDARDVFSAIAHKALNDETTYFKKDC